MRVNWWIKMRPGLLDDPKVIQMASILTNQNDFHEAMAEGPGALRNAPSPARNARVTSERNARVTRVTLGCAKLVLIGALLRIWSKVDEHGESADDDAIVPSITISDIDNWALVPGVGEAMARVGWAEVDSANNGVRFPGFRRYGCSSNGAERQRRYRAKRKLASNHDQRVTSRVTSPIVNCCEANVTSPVTSPVTPSCASLARNARVTRVTQEKRREEKNNKETTSYEVVSSEPSNDSGLLFPTVGKQKSWSMTEELFSTLVESYPGVNVESELLKARAWLVANQSRRKTAAGMPRFLNAWLSRVQNRGGSPGLAQQASRLEGVEDRIRQRISEVEHGD